MNDRGDPPAMNTVARPDVGLAAIFLVFLRIGLLSFGGGLSGWIYQEVVERRAWLTAEDFLSGLALAQVLPGINVTNLAIYIGQRLAGIPGAASGLVGLLLGPFFVVIAAATVYDRIAGIAWLHDFLDGMAAAAIGLLLSVGLKAAQREARGPASVFVLLATFLAVGVLRWPLVPVVLCLVPLSVALAWKRNDA